jgi:hypothetical protein
MTQPSIDQISRMISENINEHVNVSGFGNMTKKQALRSAVTYLRQIADKIEDGDNVPPHFFDLAKNHYLSAVSNTERTNNTGNYKIDI